MATLAQSSSLLLDRMAAGKQASIGGEQETGFEQAFFSLAYAYILDHAPQLLEHAIGFQLVDRNDDNTKAMGVFGFKLGKQWLYAPVFFINGDLKGHELLYIKSQDAFVPLKENWVNYLMARRPHVLGEGSSRDTYQLGGMQPSLRAMHGGIKGRAKYGSASDAEWLKPVMPLLAAGLNGQARFLYPRDVPAGDTRLLDMKKVAAAPFTAALAWQPQDMLRNFLGANIDNCKTAFAICQRHPAIKLAFDRFYGPNFFRETAEGIRSRELQKAASLVEQSPIYSRVEREKFADGLAVQVLSLPAAERHQVLRHMEKSSAAVHKLVTQKLAALSKLAKGQLIVDDSATLQKQAAEATRRKVRVISDEDSAKTETVEELDTPEKERLYADGYLVKDEREGDEFSTSYTTQEEIALTNPHDTGIYEILEAPGEFSRMLVLMAPTANDGNHPFSVLVRLDGNGESGKTWMNAHPAALFTNATETAEQDYREWWDKLPALKTLSKGGHYMAVSKLGSGTCPFEVTDSYDEDGAYRVNFDACENYRARRPDGLPKQSPDVRPYDPSVSNYGAVIRVNARPDTELRAIGGELNVPGSENFKFFKLKDPPKPTKEEKEDLLGCCGCSPSSSMPYDTPGSDPKPINPGDISSIQLLFKQKTAAMTLWGDAHEVSIRAEGRPTVQMPWRSALFSLVLDHGLSEKVAGEMLAAAKAKSGIRADANFRIKYALGFGPTSPSIPDQDFSDEQLSRNRSVRSTYPQEDYLPVDELDASQNDPSLSDPFLEPDQGAMQVAQRAGQEGQKEVFDTAALSSMLKAVRQDTLVDRHLGDLMKAVDSLGRIYFSMLWHGEEFEDRYSKSDMPELSDAVRNAFESVGDVVLFLKEKSVEPGLNDSDDPNIDHIARN